MMDLNTPLACLTVKQFFELLKEDRKKPEPTKIVLPKYLSVSELSSLIGWKVTTCYQNHHRGLIPGARKIRGRLLFETEAVMNWVDQNAIPTKAERSSKFRDGLKI